MSVGRQLCAMHSALERSLSGLVALNQATDLGLIVSNNPDSFVNRDVPNKPAFTHLPASILRFFSLYNRHSVLALHWPDCFRSGIDEFELVAGHPALRSRYDLMDRPGISCRHIS